MFIRVSGAEFSKKLLGAIRSKKETVNFHLVGRTLYLQTLGLVSHNIRLNVLETDMTELDASFVFDKVVSLINTKEDVILYLMGDILRAYQTNFEFSAVRSYEERMQNEAFSVDIKQSYSKVVLEEVVNDAKQMDGLARTLGVGYASLTFYNGYAYIKYSNMMMRWKVDFCNMSISIEALRWLIQKTGDTHRYLLDEESGTLYVYVSEDEVLTTKVNTCNMSTVEVFNKLDNEGKEVIIQVLSSKYNSEIEMISKLYEKSLIDVSFCSNAEIKVYIDNMNTRFEYGSRANIVKSIRISTIQLFTMLKTLGDGQTSVEIGENKLWLRQIARGKDLIVAGMIF